MRFDLQLATGRARGELAAELSVPDGAALDVRLPLAAYASSLAALAPL